MSADVIIIGAGIIGAACAHELAQQGLKVLVLDARLGGATNAGMGHLVLMDDNPAFFQLGLIRPTSETPETIFLDHVIEATTLEEVTPPRLEK